MLQLKKCKSCGFLVSGSGKCRITGQTKNQEDFCDNHNSNPPICARCGAYTLRPIIENDKYLCQRCAEEILTCIGCALNAHCDFEENPSKTPKYLQKRTPIGIQTVKNPARIRETCEKDCKCYSQENECMRQFKWCAHYEGEQDAEV